MLGPLDLEVISITPYEHEFGNGICVQGRVHGIRVTGLASTDQCTREEAIERAEYEMVRGTANALKNGCYPNGMPL